VNKKKEVERDVLGRKMRCWRRKWRRMFSGDKKLE